MSEPTLLRKGAVKDGVLAVAGDGFGWGSAGILTSILEALASPEASFGYVGLDTDVARSVLARQAIEQWIDTSSMSDTRLAQVLKSYGVSAALVVLNAELAIRLEKLDVPVVYVDTNPFMWTRHELIPHNVSHYCAQLCPALPALCWPVLSRIANLRWVERIVPPTPGRSVDRQPDTAVLNLGGMVSPLSSARDTKAYADLIVTSSLSVLGDLGFKRVLVAGNTGPGGDPPRTYLNDMRIDSRAMSRDVFLDEVAAAEIVLTAPGQTTILELGLMDRGAVLLPPQNLSQILHAIEVSHVVGANNLVSWPEALLDQQFVLDHRERGEDWALTYMYEQVAKAATEPAKALSSIESRCKAALNAHRSSPQSFAPMVEVTGVAGAKQVAAIVREVFRQFRGSGGSR